MKAKKQTAGEKVSKTTVGNLNIPGERAFLARRIDALVRRAVREAYSGGFDCGRNDCRGSCAVRDRLNTKYGAKLS